MAVMPAEGSMPFPYDAVKDLCRAETWGMSSSKLSEPPLRMEGIFYASEGYRALESMRASGFDLDPLGLLSEIRWFGPFARKYVTDPQHGLPFLTSSTMMEARPREEKLISIRHTGHLQQLLVREGYVLVSCSGTVGNVMLCTSDVDGWACSQDAIRVIVRDDVDLGPVYCYLQSPLGQFLLKRSQTGSVVRHLYADDVSGLPMPRLPRRLREELTRLIREASSLRVEANHLLDEADELVLRQNYLEREAPTQRTEFAAYTASSDAVHRAYRDEGYMRLDAGFYDPWAVRLRRRLKLCPRWDYLASVATITLIGKTFVPGVYKVEKSHGLRYFTGRELFRARIRPETFITSRYARDIERLIVHLGTVLVTCAGTSGRVAFVGEELEGAAVTHDAMRICSKGSLHGGYIYAYLASDVGRQQLRRYTYGSIHERLHDSQLSRVVIAIPNDDGREVGERVVAAFTKCADARRREDAAIQLHGTAIHHGRKITEAEWGREY